MLASIQFSRKGGFTLVELLLTLFIVSLLAGLTASGAGALRQLAETRETEVRLLAIVSACRLFRVDRGYWPEAIDEAGGALALASSMAWQHELAEYLLEHPIGQRYADAFGNEALYVVVDADADGWIEGTDLPGIREAERPRRIRAAVVCFSLDGAGKLAGRSWGAHAEVR